MNDDLSGQNRFDAWEDLVTDAVAFAERFPQGVRSGIVQALLSHTVSPSATASTAPSTPNSGPISSDHGDSGIDAVARAAQVNVNILRRFIQVDEDGTVTVRARLGASRADSQNIYGALLAYVRETALGELNTEAELIHAICNEHACMDGNLAANLRKREWLLEHGVKGGNKSYRLSPAGEQAAREQIVALCAVESG
ncbi:MAG: hypothetical protein F4X47_11615 [Gammaproteobacteria bacterium]|nr:hypothetical protein [Gammaproteobacteria bacterium]MYC52951.1 hypothetical protein [Gammaproteobacteria bacterium]